MNIAISTVKESDITKVIEIQDECNLSRWSAEDYQKEIKRKTSILLTAKIRSETVGFLTARFIKFKVHAEESVERADMDILNFGVFTKFQKRGIGNLLFEHLFNEFTVIRLETVWLEVRESNVAAIGFYKKRGFQAVQTRKNFYRQPVENAVVMKLKASKLDYKIFNKT